MSPRKLAGPLPAGTTIKVVDSSGILEAIETLTTEVRAMRRELAALREVKAAPHVVRVAEPAREASAPAPALLDLDDVAAMVRLGVRAIRRMAAAGQFPASLPIDEGRAERWRRTDVEAWVAAQSKACEAP
jgi:predicted DNA-binding transcriptional regulator AlpA